MTPQSIYVPLAALGDAALAELYLNNVAPRAVDVHYVIYSPAGESIVAANLSLHPWEARRVRVADLLKNAGPGAPNNLGGITLDYMGRRMGLLAQMLYLGAGERNSIDGIFFYATDLPSTVQNATWSMPRGSEATLILGNSSNVSVVADLSADNHEEQKLTLAPHETRLVRLRDDRRQTKAHFARVNYSGPRGALREAGFVIGEQGYAAPIRFYDREASPQADLFATDLPVQDSSVTMTLFNTGTTEVVARPSLFPIGGGGQPQIELEPIRLAPGQTAALTLQDGDRRLQGSKADAFSVRVESNGAPGDLIGSLVSVRQDDDTGVAEVPLRVPGKPGQSTGSYPLRLDDDFSSQVTIMNVGLEPKQYFAYIQKPSLDKYVFAPRTLAPGEVARFDINALRDQQQKDAFGHTLPRGLKTGKFVWSIAAPWASARMIGRAYIRSAKGRINASFSCGICCPVVGQGPFANAEPGGIFGIGDFRSGTITSETNDCEGNLTTFPDSLNSSFDNPSVLSYSEPGSGVYETTAIGVGSTSMSYAFTFANIEFDSQDCFVQGPFENTNTDTAAVNPAIKPSRGVLGKSIDVTITGSNFDANTTITPSGAGVTVSNLMVQPPGTMTATLVIATNADPGPQTLTISPSGGSVSFYVQKPTALQPLTRPGFPGGAQAVQKISDGTVSDANGNTIASHQCGIYQNFIYGLFDQDNPAQQIVQAYTAVESFDNHHGVGQAPDGLARGTGGNGILSDIQSITKAAGVCLSATDHEDFQQHFTIRLGDADHDLSVPVQPCITIRRGNFTGNDSASPNNYTLQRTLSCQ